MKTWVRKSLNVGVLSAGFLLISGGAAHADWTTGYNAGPLNGNQFDTTLQVPVNVCGNSIAVLGFADASCGGGAAAIDTESATTEHFTTGYNAGIQLQTVLRAPINVSGNSIAILGFSSASCNGGATAIYGGMGSGAGHGGGWHGYGNGGWVGGNGGNGYDNGGNGNGYDNGGNGNGNGGNGYGNGGNGDDNGNGGNGYGDNNAAANGGYGNAAADGDNGYGPDGNANNNAYANANGDASNMTHANGNASDTHATANGDASTTHANGNASAKHANANGNASTKHASTKHANAVSAGKTHKAKKAHKSVSLDEHGRRHGAGAANDAGYGNAAANGDHGNGYGNHGRRHHHHGGGKGHGMSNGGGGAMAVHGGCSDWTTGYTAGLLNGNQLSTIVQFPVNISGNSVGILGFLHAHSSGGALGYSR